MRPSENCSARIAELPGALVQIGAPLRRPQRFLGAAVAAAQVDDQAVGRAGHARGRRRDHARDAGQRQRRQRRRAPRRHAQRRDARGPQPGEGRLDVDLVGGEAGPLPFLPQREHAMKAAQPHRQLRARPQLGVERRDLDGDVLVVVARLERAIGDDDIRDARRRAATVRAFGLIAGAVCLAGLAAAQPVRDRADVVGRAAVHGRDAQPVDAHRATHPEHDAQRNPHLLDGHQRRLAGRARHDHVIEDDGAEAAVAAADRDRPPELLGGAARDHACRQRAAHQHVEQQHAQHHAARDAGAPVRLDPRQHPRAQTDVYEGSGSA